MAYAIRFALKPVVDCSVPPLQGLWWSPDPEVFTTGDRAAWQWTMMITQPPQASTEVVGAALEMARAKKKTVAGVRFEEYAEGTGAQILHTGPYSEEPQTIVRLMDHVYGSGRQISGKHHEIYLTPPRTDAPGKMRTLIRYPLGNDLDAVPVSSTGAVG
ncbi:MAG: GyrI-like domain-containing protein [Kibdelosporangium sp.]